MTGPISNQGDRNGKTWEKSNIKEKEAFNLKLFLQINNLFCIVSSKDEILSTSSLFYRLSSNDI